ncbi:MAG: 7TM diverse intracellular signaling domain-containing protein [Aliarcobacter sp.]|nr:7TM diverse intracellular signaling domain-containing protein [Aliarcobacter sp.]
MNIPKWLVFIFIFFIYSNAFEISSNIQKYEILNKSAIYIDYSKQLDFEQIKSKDFTQNSEKTLSYGYSPKFNVWIKFTLSNSENNTIHKILEYVNPLTTNIELYDSSTGLITKEGLFNINENRKSINPIFKIELNSNETKTYYLKVNSSVTTLIVGLNLLNMESFYEEEVLHQSILSFFFGAMIILALYNLFIYFFTKDKNYLFYLFYIIGIIFHHLLYVGIAYLYIPNPLVIEKIISLSSLIVGLPAFALALFTRSFLDISKYPKIDKILKTYLYFFPFMILIFLITDMFDKYRNIFSVILLVLLFVITIYATYRKNRQAYFILFGWCIFITAGMYMYLSSVGLFNGYEIFPYYVEISLVLEAIIFSIALTDKIKQLQKQKDFMANKLLIQQKDEKQRLQIVVNEKTKDLIQALDEKELLLKELNHRVKNNMQTILSLIRLQYIDIEDEKIQDIFITIQNRIKAMSHLHELLYEQNSITTIDTNEYFKVLIEELKYSYEQNIKIIYDIKTDLKIDKAIYCGLILNELVTNCFKHAFISQDGIVNISLTQVDSLIELKVKDNGRGFDNTKSTDSLGLVLVNTLAKEQLKGTLLIKSIDGTSVTISWRENG